MNTGAVAKPVASVVAVLTPPAKFPLAPVAGFVNVTVRPLAGLPTASRTRTCMLVANAAFTSADCGVPAVAVILAGGPAEFVREKSAPVTTPATVAETVYAPAVPFAVKTPAVATPLAFVTAVFIPPAKFPLAPLPGLLNVTVTPLTGLLLASRTMT